MLTGNKNENFVNPNYSHQQVVCGGICQVLDTAAASPL